MTRIFVDLSIPLENGVKSDPPGYELHIEYLDHHDTAPHVAKFFDGFKVQDLPDGEGWGMEWIKLMTHNGTHLDAPYHFHLTMNKGERAITIDEVPLEGIVTLTCCFGTASAIASSDAKHLVQAASLPT